MSVFGSPHDWRQDQFDAEAAQKGNVAMTPEQFEQFMMRLEELISPISQAAKAILADRQHYLEVHGEADPAFKVSDEKAAS